MSADLVGAGGIWGFLQQFSLGLFLIKGKPPSAPRKSCYTCSDMKYWLGQNGRQYVPFTAEDLRRMALEGRISPNDWVGREGDPRWVPFGQAAPALFAPATPSQSTPPPPSRGYPATPSAISTFESGTGNSRFSISPYSLEWLKSYLAIAAIILGFLLLLPAINLAWYPESLAFAVPGAVSLAYGIDYFLARGRLRSK
jgi:hypothetical protein